MRTQISQLGKILAQNPLATIFVVLVLAYGGLLTYNKVGTVEVASTVCAKGAGNVVYTTAGAFTVPDIERTDYDYRNVAYTETFSSDEIFKSITVGEPRTLTLLRRPVAPFDLMLVDVGYAKSGPRCPMRVA